MKIQKNKIVRPTIYCYTTPNDLEHRGWCKIGYTDSESADECIYHQSRRTDTECHKEWESPAIFDDHEPFTDHLFHRYLTLLGIERKESVYKGKKAPEYFKIDPKLAQRYLMEFKMKIHPEEVLQAIKSENKLRQEQEEAINLTLDIMSKDGPKEVLLNAKPRFGKTFTVYHYIKRENLKRILIATNRPVIVTSWYSDFEKCLNPEKYIFVSKDYEELKNLNAKYISQNEWKLFKDKDKYGLIEFVSYQDLKGSKWFNPKKTKNKLKDIADTKWDLLVLDESHEASDTRQSRTAFKQIHRKRTIYLSGTPFKQIANAVFKKDAIFNWTYADEQEKKANWDYDIDDVNPYEELPKLNLFTYKLNDIFKKDVDITSNNIEEIDKYFDLNKFFATTNDGNSRTFENNEDIDIFLDKLAKDPRFPIANPDLNKQINHSLWLLNRVNSAKALMTKLKDKDRHPEYKDYKIILAAGDGKENEEDENVDKAYNQVIDGIKKYKKTITLSVGQLTTGVTIPEWSAVFMLCNLESPSSYIQASFRVQNPCKIQTGIGEFEQKDNAYIFDFDPSRTLRIIDQFANDLYSETSSGKGTEKQRLENISKLLKYFPIYGENNIGELIEYTANDIVTIPTKIQAVEIVRHGFMSSILFQNVGKLFNDPRGKEIVNNFSSTKEYKSTGNASYNEDGTAKIDQNKVKSETAKIINGIDNSKIVKEVIDYKNSNNKSNEEFINILYEDRNENKKNRDEKLDAHVTKLVNDKVNEFEESIKINGPSIINVSKISKQYKDGLIELLTDIKDEHELNIKRIEDEYIKDRNQAKTEEDLIKAVDKYKHSHDEEINRNGTQEILSMNKYTEEFTNTKVEQQNKDDQEKKNREEEKNYVYPKLKSFSRSIPSFLMAYGDENTTCRSLAAVVPDKVFSEIVSEIIDDKVQVTLDDYKYLVNNDYFNEPVFNAAIKEFMNLKDKLSNYFETKESDEDIFDYIPPQKSNQIFTPKKVVKMMIDFLEENDPGCFDDPEKTFIDPYMKSGLYITEIVKRLYNSKKIKEAYPDDKKRLEHIFEKQVYGLAPTEILYKITTNFIFGFDKNNSYDRSHFIQLDANKYVGGKLEQTLNEIWG